MAGICKSFMKKLKDENGFALVELFWACAILAVFSCLAVPAADSLYRQAALEYETEHLLGEIRHLQMLSRTADYARQDQKGGGYFSNDPSLIINYSGYMVMRGDHLEYSYKFLPGINMDIGGVNVDSRYTLRFKKNGELFTKVLTIVLFAHEDINDGNAIIIDGSGRIRVERR